MHDESNPQQPILAWRTVRSRDAAFGKPGSLIGVYLLRATSAELDALVREIESHDYWTTADPLSENFRTLPEVSPAELRRELYWLFQD